MLYRIGFNKPYFTGKETTYIEQAVTAKKISGDGLFTQRCHEFFEKRYNFRKCLLTTSCTDALEMIAILLNIGPDDEVIAPAFTFVSTVNAFVLRGASILFADSSSDHPNVDPDQIESLISSKTKAIVLMHYAGIACDLERISATAGRYHVPIVEDAAHATDSFHHGRPLGSLGVMSAFSFHETKNVTCGEGGMLVINDERYLQRAEVIREKGTNRSAFFRGEIDKYGWVDIGSSFLPSDITAAFLYAQLECLDEIQTKRRRVWNRYYSNLRQLVDKRNAGLPVIPEYATNNAHMFYVVCRSLGERNALIRHLANRNIQATFHYLPLHKSPYYSNRHDGRELPNCERFSDCLVRLPFYNDLSDEQIDEVSELVLNFYS